MAGRICPTCGREMTLKKSPMNSKHETTESEQRLSSGNFQWVCPHDGTTLAVGQE